MAERAVVMRRIDKWGDDAHVAEWTGLANGDTGEAIEMPGSNDRSIHFQGTFGVGGSIQLEGTNELVPTNYHLLTDPQGNDIVKTAADLEAVTELTRWVRPRVTAGDGTTNLSAHLMLRRPMI